MARAEVTHRDGMHEAVVRVVVPEADRRGIELVEQRVGSRTGRRIWRAPTGVDGDAAPLPREDVVEHTPGRERSDLALECGLAVEPLEDGGVRIESVLVAVDARVGSAAEHFVVAGIRKLETVR